MSSFSIESNVINKNGEWIISRVSASQLMLQWRIWTKGTMKFSELETFKYFNFELFYPDKMRFPHFWFTSQISKSRIRKEIGNKMRKEKERLTAATPPPTITYLKLLSAMAKSRKGYCSSLLNSKLCSERAIVRWEIYRTFIGRLGSLLGWWKLNGWIRIWRGSSSAVHQY